MSNGTRQFRAHRRAGAVTFRTPADAGSAGAGRPCNRQGLSGHRPQHQEGRPSTSPAPARPAAPHLDAKNTPRSLSGCFRSGNSGSSGNGSPHECVIVRKRSTPSGTATGTTARAAGTAAPGGRPSTSPAGSARTSTRRTPREAFPGAFAAGTAGAAGTAVRMSASSFASVQPPREQPREQPPGQREQQCQEAGPRPARPAAPAPRREEHHAKPFRVLWQREQREHGNGSPHECVIVRKRSTPSGTATGTTAKAAGTAAPGGRPSTLTSSAPARPAGPVAPPQPGRRTQRTARHDRRPCGPLLALGAGLPSIPGQKQESRHGAGSGGGKGPPPRGSRQQRRPDRVALRQATAREAPVARQAARLMDKVPGIPQRRSHGNRVPALADD